MDVSIIIVNYNTRALLADCLTSIYAHTKDIQFEVIVCDNGSTDGSLAMVKNDFPQVILIENNENLGFGRANNRGRAVATGTYVLYLNSDTLLLNNAVKYFFDYWESAPDKETIGGLGCNLRGPDGNIRFSYDAFPDINRTLWGLTKTIYGITKRTLRHVLHLPPLQETVPQYAAYTGEVESIVGADLFLKNNAFAQFDEFYFMYHEETDLEYTLHKNGFKFFLIDGPKIIHLEGASATRETNPIKQIASFSSLNFFTNRIYFFKKNNCPPLKVWTLKLLTLLLWLNPLIFPAAKKYILKMIRI